MNEQLMEIVRKLAALSEALDNGNSSAEYAVANLAAKAKALLEEAAK